MSEEKEAFQQWVNHPVTQKVKRALLEELEATKNNIMDDRGKDIEEYGTLLLAAQNYIYGLKRFTDFDALWDHLEGEYK